MADDDRLLGLVEDGGRVDGGGGASLELDRVVDPAHDRATDRLLAERSRGAAHALFVLWDKWQK